MPGLEKGGSRFVWQGHVHSKMRVKYLTHQESLTEEYLWLSSCIGRGLVKNTVSQVLLRLEKYTSKIDLRFLLVTGLGKTPFCRRACMSHSGAPSVHVR